MDQATAAAGALAAGVLAYIGAVRQVRLQERAQEVRALAYRFRLLRVVEEYHEQVARACAVAEGQLAAFRSGSAPAAITSFQLVKPRMLHDDNWEAHALLGRRAVELILTIDDLSLRLAQFDQEIRAQGTHTDSSFANATLRQGDANEAGQPALVQEHAIVDYAQALDRLRAALAELARSWRNRSGLLSWRKLRAVPRPAAERKTGSRCASQNSANQGWPPGHLTHAQRLSMLIHRRRAGRPATGPLRIRRLLHATASVATYILLAVLTVPWLALHIVGWMCIALRRPARRAGVIRSRRQWTTSSHPVPTDSGYRELARSCSNASFAFLNQASRVALEPLGADEAGFCPVIEQAVRNDVRLPHAALRIEAAVLSQHVLDKEGRRLWSNLRPLPRCC